MHPRRRLSPRQLAFAGALAGALLAAPAAAAPHDWTPPSVQVAQTRTPAETRRRPPARPQQPRRARRAAEQPHCVQTGLARWYGPGFHGGRTASGERFDQNAMTAASATLPLGTWVRVTRLDNRRSIVVRINDRHAGRDGTVIDLARGAAARLGIVAAGVSRVCVARTARPAPEPRARVAQRTRTAR